MLNINAVKVSLFTVLGKCKARPFSPSLFLSFIIPQQILVPTSHTCVCGEGALAPPWISLHANFHGTSYIWPLLLMTRATSTHDKWTWLEEGTSSWKRPLVLKEMGSQLIDLIKQNSCIPGRNIFFGTCYYMSIERALLLKVEYPFGHW